MARSNPSSPQNSLFRLTLGGFNQMAGWISSLLPDRDQRLVWQEFQNKIRSFELFANVESVLALSPGRRYSASDLMERALRLGPFESVWAAEGVGHYLAERGQDATEAPPRFFVPIHAGLGLTLAIRTLAPLGDSPSPAQLKEALESFLARCRSHAYSGYEMVTYEALGLVTRSQYPHLVQPVAEQSAAIHPELEEYFWHGVGRSLYFLPPNAMPSSCAPWIAVRNAMQEPPHDSGRRNALAGLVWAMALVNLRYPEIVALFLSHHRDVICRDDAFANGLTSAMRVWFETSPDDPTPSSFLAYRSRDPDLRRRWEEQIAGPCRDTLPAPGTVAEGWRDLPPLFRYKPLVPRGVMS